MGLEMIQDMPVDHPLTYSRIWEKMCSIDIFVQKCAVRKRSERLKNFREKVLLESDERSALNEQGKKETTRK